MIKYKIDQDLKRILFVEKEEDKKYVLAVRDLPDWEKPREKLIKNGPAALNMAELLAIVLGTGTKREEVMSMSHRLLREYGEKAIVHEIDPKVIERELKIPNNKACQIVACFELGRRLFTKKPGGKVVIRSAKDAFEYLKDMRYLNKEQFRVLYLSDRYQLVHDEVISLGTANASLVQIREIFKPALEYMASAVIIAHNHPSGSLKPSASDMELTDKIIEAGKILDISVLDHIIVTKNKFFSIM